MYGRMTRIQGSPDAIEKGVASFEKDVSSPASQLPGFQGIVLMVNRETGEAISVSYWQDEAALKATEPVSVRMRSEVAESTGTTVTEVSTGEILDMIRIAPAQSGTFIRLNTVDGQPDKLDAAIERYRTKIIPALKECPGLRAAILSVNREQSRLVVSSVWNSAQEREASDARLLDLRRETGEIAGAQAVKVELFESAFVNMPVQAAIAAN